MIMEKTLITVMKFTKLYPTRFVKERLESEGIECVLTDEGFVGDDSGLPVGWNLKVREKDVAKTVELILEIQKDYGLDNINELSTLKDLKRIMVPVDLSNYSPHVIKYAFGIAEKMKAEIKFLYVLEDPHLPGAVKYTTSWEKHEKIEKVESYKKAQALLLDFSDELKNQVSEKQQKSVKFHFAIHTGKLGNTIVSLSHRYHPDIILMGHKIKKDDEKEHLAKVTHYIIEHSKYPVLILPKSLVYKGLSDVRIMYATDFLNDDHSPLNKLIEITKPFFTKIHCIHIECEYSNPVVDSRVSELNYFFRSEYRDYDIQADVYECKNVPLGIEEFVDKNKIDMISLSSAKHNFIYKIFHVDILNQMIAASKVSILVFPI